MNRMTGLILALAIGTAMSACASAGTGSGPAGADAPSNAAQGTKPSENRYTREANRTIGLAMLRQTAEEKRDLYQQALQQALQSIETEPGNPRGWYLAGQAYANLGDLVAADTTFAKAQALYPAYEAEIAGERENAWVAAYNAGVQAHQQGDRAKAIEHMELADRIFSKRPEARLNLGAFYAQDNQVDKAIAAFRGALEVLRGPIPEAYDEAARKDWRDNEEMAAMNLAQMLSSADREAEAEQVYREFAELNPDHVGAQVSLAEMLVRQGKNDQAAEIYTRLLARTDLSDSDYLMMGVGFFRAERFPEAANAFRKTTEKNAYNRDGFYNLAQALYMHANKLDEKKKTAKGDALKQVNDELSQVFGELIGSTGKVLEFDPLNRNILAYMARAYQSLGEIGATPATRSDARAKVQQVMKRYEDAALEVDEVSLRPGEGNVQVNGAIRNLKLTAGQSVQIRVTILGAGGTPIGSQVATVSAPAANSSAAFQLSIPVTGEMLGWKYEIVK